VTALQRHYSRPHHNFLERSTGKWPGALCFYRERAKFLQPASCVFALGNPGRPSVVPKTDLSGVRREAFHGLTIETIANQKGAKPCFQQTTT
jgi:hypothetical protein